MSPSERSPVGGAPGFERGDTTMFTGERRTIDESVLVAWPYTQRIPIEIPTRPVARARSQVHEPQTRPDHRPG